MIVVFCHVSVCCDHKSLTFVKMETNHFSGDGFMST